MSFIQEFDQHGAWRRQFALRLKLLSEWLVENDLMEAGVRERLDQLHAQVRNDKIMVAFVAEFSRGKSELINAMFFAGYGRRIMPASAGRTTMCPTELGFDPEIPPCLRLLPIETRLQPQSLLDWRNATDKWERVDLDVNDPKQLAKAIQKVSEVRRVSQEEARSLGFWSDEAPEDNPLPGSDGLVEVPKWRHALINMAHPLLKQGLVILDTPGLNAIGAEPELTVSLLPQAHAVVFILGADTGVTKSDLTIWRQHLAVASADSASRLVVLNKIDTLWDALSTPEQVQLQIAAQRVDSAEILGVSPRQVLAVSAQKGLLAKVQQDPVRLAASHLPDPFQWNDPWFRGLVVTQGPDGWYATLGAAVVELMPASNQQHLQGRPYLQHANAIVQEWRLDANDLWLELQSHVPLQAELRQVAGCQIISQSPALKLSRQADTFQLSTAEPATVQLQLRCPQSGSEVLQ
mgnify:CR=1 FL=1